MRDSLSLMHEEIMQKKYDPEYFIPDSELKDNWRLKPFKKTGLNDNQKQTEIGNLNPFLSKVFARGMARKRDKTFCVNTYEYPTKKIIKAKNDNITALQMIGK